VISESHPRVVVVGSVMVDLIAYSQVLPRAGQTVVGSRFESGFGGKGANQAVMAALLGAKVHFVGAVGRDFWGDEAIANLQRYGVRTDGVMRSDEHTGLAPIWVEVASGENRIIVIPGANRTLDPEFVLTALEGLQYDVVLCQLEVPQEAAAAALSHGRQQGAITILNPAPWTPLSEELFAVTDWLVPNESEFVGLARQLGIGLSSVEEATARVSEKLQVRLAVTIGEQGALLSSNPGEAPVRVPAPKVDVCDTTGAGDAFVGTFAFRLALRDEPVPAATLACDRAAQSVTLPGTQASFIPTPKSRTARGEREDTEHN